MELIPNSYLSVQLSKTCSRGNASPMQVKGAAVEIVEGLTGSADGVDKLKSVTDSLLPALFRCTSGVDPTTSRKALVALVNLSQDTAVADKLLSLNVAGRIMDYIREKTCPHMDLMVRL